MSLGPFIPASPFVSVSSVGSVGIRIYFGGREGDSVMITDNKVQEEDAIF